eukprot:CAMPEP_0172628890 /NCGR_PEP_ID=MMETSP1068-20121228/164410_1 /TAXON_ID=35684 /ORGANISM="Pseudopedinella elastica, Strain CCMP716" /LENGTH=233 /DNA_ID=CAMNT_0013439259 /DNA_START=41 /DNA_END=739 /DNA_ORIENTATION=+
MTSRQRTKEADYASSAERSQSGTFGLVVSIGKQGIWYGGAWIAALYVLWLLHSLHKRIESQEYGLQEVHEGWTRLSSTLVNEEAQPNRPLLENASPGLLSYPPTQQSFDGGGLASPSLPEHPPEPARFYESYTALPNPSLGLSAHESQYSVNAKRVYLRGGTAAATTRTGASQEGLGPWFAEMKSRYPESGPDLPKSDSSDPLKVSCVERRRIFGVNPGKSWGSLSKKQQDQW